MDETTEELDRETPVIDPSIHPDETTSEAETIYVAGEPVVADDTGIEALLPAVTIEVPIVSD